ncbi:MAG: BON domain-containing protein [Desulfobacteraceae bacterium]|jgi:osmotically-inducible protein OsmY|nr:BON domain-containing protein [Desulfobacteraceae bacterium]
MKVCELRIHRNTQRYKWILILRAVISILLLLPAVAAAVNDIRDNDITLAIDRQLQNDEGVPADLVGVRTMDGIVTLSGSLDNLLARERAAEIAATIKGVRSVINLIEVQSLIRTDAQIRTDVEQALLGDPAADAFEIKVSVRDGSVILTGMVDSWPEKQLCLMVAKGVIGVKEVKSNITVLQKSERADDDIRADIERRLAYDVWVDDAQIDIKVMRGKVVLSGIVRSLSAKTRAFRGAWVSGVTSVVDKDLVVDWSRSKKMRRQFENYPIKLDEEIKQVLKEVFFYDPRLSPFNLNVLVENGVVTLSGQVHNLKARQVAEQDANNTTGVWLVKNQINVRPGMGLHTSPRPDVDAELARKIRLALLRNPYTHQHEIGVSVNNRLVMLDGTVNSNLEKAKAEDVVSAVKGVAAVMNNLKINRTWTPKNDRKIKKDIEDGLWWSPFVDEDEVAVTVADGIATLVGVVDTLRERRAATTNAYEGGASQVRNLLKVRYGPESLRP